MTQCTQAKHTTLSLRKRNSSQSNGEAGRCCFCTLAACLGCTTRRLSCNPCYRRKIKLTECMFLDTQIGCDCKPDLKASGTSQASTCCPCLSLVWLKAVVFNSGFYCASFEPICTHTDNESGQTDIVKCLLPLQQDGVILQEPRPSQALCQLQGALLQL